MGLFSRRKKDQPDQPEQPGGDEPPEETPEEMMAGYADAFVVGASGAASPIGLGDLDFSMGSLQHVDAYLGHYFDNGQMLSENNQLAASAYVFEVLRREHGGRYLGGPDDNPYVLVIGEPDGQIGVMVMGKVRGRAENGLEDNIPFFVEGIPAMIESKQGGTLI